MTDVSPNLLTGETVATGTHRARVSRGRTDYWKAVDPRIHHAVEDSVTDGLERLPERSGNTMGVGTDVGIELMNRTGCACNLHWVVDLKTQKRTPKMSANWFWEAASRNTMV